MCVLLSPLWTAKYISQSQSKVKAEVKAKFYQSQIKEKKGYENCPEAWGLVCMLISIKKPLSLKINRHHSAYCAMKRCIRIYAYTHVVTSFHILQCKYVNKNNHIKQSHVLHYTTLYSLFRKDRRILRSTWDRISLCEGYYLLSSWYMRIYVFG